MQTATADKSAVYDRVDPFFEGLAVAYKDHKQFHIREDYTPAYEQRFEVACTFIHGFARVKSDGKWFHILPTGEPAYAEKYDWISPFNNGVAAVLSGDRRLKIRPDGSLVNESLPPLK